MLIGYNLHHEMLLLCFLGILNIAKCDIEESSVKYIADLVKESIAQALVYEGPESAIQYKAFNKTPADYGLFDYIIVGAGSAGAVLATRLSEDAKLNILLLEPGGQPSTFSSIPGMSEYLLATELNWNYKTVPQTTNCLGMVDHRCNHPQGRGLGGSSIINSLMYVRGNRHDFDTWALEGNVGWSYTDVLPFFTKSENSQIDGDLGYHGKGGLFNVEYHRPYSPIFYAFIQANQELGQPVLDYNGREQLGVAKTQLNNINGRRHSTERAFLKTAAARPNLKIVTHGYATKVLIDRKKRAYGVLFDHDGQTYNATVEKEVILSAGAIGSPQLLMLSGIGPSSVLGPLGLPIVSDLPVGQNYQNHPAYLEVTFSTNYTEPFDTIEELSRQFLKSSGQFTIAFDGQGIGFIRTKSATTPLSVPNIELVVLPHVPTGKFIQKCLNYNSKMYFQDTGTVNSQQIFVIAVILLHPKSRGTVTLTTASPYKYPDIDANFFSDKYEQDIQELYEGISYAMGLTNTTGFKKINAQLLPLVLPACLNYTYNSREHWFCQIRHLASHIYHPVGTCKMGLRHTGGGVVDNELKVYGVQNLRVVDASIIPNAPSGHLNAVAIMIAEKIAWLLRYFSLTLQ